MANSTPMRPTVLAGTTTRTRAEEAPREGEARLHDILSVSPAAIYVLNPDYVPLWVSHNIIDMSGYSVSECLTPTWWVDHLHPDDRDAVFAARRMILADGYGSHEYRFCAADGRYLWICDQLRVVCDAAGQPLEIVGAWMDVTQRKQTEQALTAAQRLREVILESVEEGIHSLNLDGNIVFENPAALEMFGWRAHEMVGWHAHTLMHHHYPDGRPYPVEDCPIYRSLRDGQVRTVRNELFFRKDGTSFPVEYTVAALRDDSDAIVGVIVSFRDVTERQRAEEALRESEVHRRATDEASRLKSAFMDMMSHELRTPLNAVIGFSALLEDGTAGPLTDKQARFAQHISGSGRYLLSLVNNLLDFSIMQAGTLKLRLEPFDLPEALHAAVADIRPQAELKRLDLALRVEEAPSTLIADLNRFRQIVLHLLANAVKFTPDGGRITVIASHSGEFVDIAVADTGIGIRPADLTMLFQPFIQLEPALPTSLRGTGLGLVLTKRLTELHGGTMSAASEGEGCGSIFTVRLPLTCAPSALTASDRPRWWQS